MTALTAPEFAATIQQPYAQMIAEAAVIAATGLDPKLTENRSRPIPAKHIGTRIGIHAGRRWSEVGQHDRRVREAWSAFGMAISRRQMPGVLAQAIADGDSRTGVVGSLRPGLWMEQGVIVAVATLVDCHKADQTSVATCCQPWGDRTYTTAAGVVPAWHLRLADVQRLTRPVPAVGKQLMPWRMPVDVVASVAAQLATAVAR